MFARQEKFVPHLFAIGLAILYGWQIAFSSFATTGLMFVSPLLLMLLTYWAFDFKMFGAAVSAQRVLANLFVGCLTLLVGIITMSQMFPGPSQANVAENAARIGGFSICMLMIAFVIAIIAGIVFVIFLIVRAIYRALTKNNNRVNDFGALMLVVFALGFMSLEGVGGGYNFPAHSDVSRTVLINAPVEKVWEAMQAASSPELKLPVVLSMLPHPVAISDEGAAAGAKRVVSFLGREGVGKLVLQAQAATANSQQWDVVNDTTPLHNWAELRSVNYLVNAEGVGTRLTLTAQYKRHLAPAWFFKPYMDFVVGTAMDVLSQDKKLRAERLAFR